MRRIFARTTLHSINADLTRMLEDPQLPDRMIATSTLRRLQWLFGNYSHIRIIWDDTKIKPIASVKQEPSTPEDEQVAVFLEQEDNQDDDGDDE